MVCGECCLTPPLVDPGDGQGDQLIRLAASPKCTRVLGLIVATRKTLTPATVLVRFVQLHCLPEALSLRIDTSIWIELVAGRTNAPSEDFLTMTTCGPVVQELLQGLRPGRQARQIRWQLPGLPRLGDPLAADLFLDAAELYASARRRGFEIRSSVDSLLAAIAIRHKTPAWQFDRDFERIAAFSPLEIWRPSGQSAS